NFVGIKSAQATGGADTEQDEPAMGHVNVSVHRKGLKYSAKYTKKAGDFGSE
ncbi:MAG: hypothetical protein JWP57_2660, partial [Spirosoma sp.]|nr:hypothetical protein [Spirosoma sp.]